MYILSNQKRNDEVLCVARIEGLKNQINLIKALSGKPYHLNLIGKWYEFLLLLLVNSRW